MDNVPKLSLDQPIFVDVVFFLRCGQPWPVRPSDGDVDNFTKAFYDALVSVGVLADDRWVIGGESKKIADSEDWYRAEIYEAVDVPVEALSGGSGKRGTD